MTTSAYRAELDGVRALAVLLVFFSHIPSVSGHGPLLAGGRIGVDIFFVLSGYLVGGLLVAELRRTGRIDLPGFWARRVRRLLPAALAMAVVTGSVVACLGAASIHPLEQARWLTQLRSGLTYTANFHEIAAGTQYTSSGTNSPYAHLWSLSAEEQIYVALPLLILAAAWCSARAPRLARVAVPTVLVGLVATVATSPQGAYFDPRPRLAEVLVGAAIAAFPMRGLRGAVGRRAAWTGGSSVVALLAIAAGTATTTETMQVTMVMPTVAALSALLLIALEFDGGHRRAFTAAPVAALGLISYGFYLWHLPVIVLTPFLTGGGAWLLSDAGRALVFFTITLALSALSFRLLERPVRSSSWLQARAKTTMVGAVVVALAAALAPAAVAGGAPTTRAVGQLPVDCGVTEGRFDGLPTLVEGCTLFDAGEGRPIVGFAGDSTLNTLVPALQQAGADLDLTILVAIGNGCSIIDVSRRDEEHAAPDLTQRRCGLLAGGVERITAASELMVILDRSPVLHAETRTADDIADAAERASKALKQITRQVPLVLLTPVRTADPVDSPDPRHFSTDARGTEFIFSYERNRDIYLGFVDDLAARDPRITVIDTDPIWCPGGQPCRGDRDGISLWNDQVHASIAGAAEITPRLLDALTGAFPAVLGR